MEQESFLTVQESETMTEAESEIIEEPKEEFMPDVRILLTKEQTNYFREIFDSIDFDRKGRIPTRMIGFVLRSIGFNPKKSEIKKHVQQIDPEHTGFVDFDLFLIPMAQRIDEEPETHEDIIAAFKVLDEEENDYMETDKLTEYLTTLGEDLEDYEMELLIKAAETKEVGKIYYTEFVEKMMGIVRKGAKSPRKRRRGKKGKKDKRK